MKNREKLTRVAALLLSGVVMLGATGCGTQATADKENILVDTETLDNNELKTPKYFPYLQWPVYHIL